MPLKELQAAVPHAHSSVFSDDPSMLVQVFPDPHVLPSQKKPVLLEQVAAPQKHVASLDAVPSVTEQEGADIQMQVKTLHSLAVKRLLNLTLPSIVTRHPLG
jgi:hypothetical protein